MVNFTALRDLLPLSIRIGPALTGMFGFPHFNQIEHTMRVNCTCITSAFWFGYKNGIPDFPGNECRVNQFTPHCFAVVLGNAPG